MPAAGIDQTYWRDVIGRGSATFFVGAGISAPAPASLPDEKFGDQRGIAQARGLLRVLEA